MSPEDPNLAWVLKHRYPFLTKKDIRWATGADMDSVDHWLKKRAHRVQGKKYPRRLSALSEILQVLEGCEDAFAHRCIHAYRKDIGEGKGRTSVLPKVRKAVAKYQEEQNQLPSEKA